MALTNETLFDKFMNDRELLLNELNQSADELLPPLLNFLRLITTYPEQAKAFNDVFSQILDLLYQSNRNTLDGSSLMPLQLSQELLTQINNHRTNEQDSSLGEFLTKHLETYFTTGKPDYLRIDLEDSLSSEKEISYANLQYYLKNQDWEEANYETYLAIMKCLDSLEGQTIQTIASAADPKRSHEKERELIDSIPKTDLQTINRLWTKYSQGQFGFWIQKRIYVKSGGGIPYFSRDTRKIFFELLGWVKKTELNSEVWLENTQFNYGLSAPKGHLPSYRFYSENPSLIQNQWIHFMARFVQVEI